MINLILRLYDPEQGSITYNQKNICDYNIKDYRSKYGIVFQDINVYAATIGQNIAMDTDAKYYESASSKRKDR